MNRHRHSHLRRRLVNQKTFNFAWFGVVTSHSVEPVDCVRCRYCPKVYQIHVSIVPCSAFRAVAFLGPRERCDIVLRGNWAEDRRVLLSDNLPIRLCRKLYPPWVQDNANVSRICLFLSRYHPRKVNNEISLIMVILLLKSDWRQWREGGERENPFQARNKIRSIMQYDEWGVCFSPGVHFSLLRLS